MKPRVALILIQVFFWLITLLSLFLFVRDHSPLSLSHIGLLGLAMINFYGYAKLAHQSLGQGLSRIVMLQGSGLSLLTGYLTLILIADLFPATPGIIWVVSSLTVVSGFNLSGILFGGLRFSFTQRQIQQQLAKEKVALELQKFH